jgi:hypothetical protein
VSRAEFTLAVGKAFAAATALGLSATTYFLGGPLGDSFPGRLLGYLTPGGFPLSRFPLGCRSFLGSFLSFAHEQSSVVCCSYLQSGPCKNMSSKKIKFYKKISTSNALNDRTRIVIH